MSNLVKDDKTGIREPRTNQQEEPVQEDDDDDSEDEEDEEDEEERELLDIVVDIRGTDRQGPFHLEGK